MLAQNGASPAHRFSGGRARKVVDTGKCRTTFKAPQSNFQEAIRAELAWSDHATALGLLAYGSSPVLTLCRMLLEAGYDSATPLEAWRGGTLCLRVRAIGAAAGFTVKSAGNGAPRFALDGARRGAAAPPVAPMAWGRA
jgi:hypothetical protein